MLRVLILLAALLAPFGAQTGFAQAQAGIVTKTPDRKDGLIKTYEHKIKANRAFLNAAEHLVGPSGSAEAKSFLKMAENASMEAAEHFAKGEYEFAVEDIAESTQHAIDAIILTKNSKDSTIRDMVIKDEMALKAKHDLERKERLIRKGIDEVEAFIKTAERLLKQADEPSARELLAHAKELYEDSRASIAGAQVDKALDEINRAYKAATGAVKKTKKSQNEVITFPKPSFTDEREMLAYELKKNDSYVSFASQVVSENDREAGGLLNRAKEAKADAVKAINEGKHQAAIEKLKISTDLFIKAIEKTSGEE